MAFNGSHLQGQRLPLWDAARPSGVTVDPTVPSYMPIPKRLPPTSPPKAILDAAMTANLIVTANNTTHVQEGPVREQMNDRLAAHRSRVEEATERVKKTKYKQRGVWDFVTLKPEADDPARTKHRQEAVNLFQTVEVLAVETTSSASLYPRGNITFEHETFAHPYRVPPGPQPTSEDRSSSDDEDEGNDKHPQPRSTLSSANGDWGSVRREQGPLRVMNPGSTVMSSSTRTRTDTMSTGWSSTATTGYPPVIRDEAHSRQNPSTHAAPPVAPSQIQTHLTPHYAAPPAAASSSQHHGQPSHTLRSPEAEAMSPFPTTYSHQPRTHPPSSSTSAIRPPEAAHHVSHTRRQSSEFGGGQLQSHPSMGRAPTYVSGTPTYSSRGNPTPDYDNDSFAQAVQEGSNLDLQYRTMMAAREGTAGPRNPAQRPSRR